MQKNSEERKDKWMKMECPLCFTQWDELIDTMELKEVKTTLFVTDGRFQRKCYQCDRKYNKPTLKNTGTR